MRYGRWFQQNIGINVRIWWLHIYYSSIFLGDERECKTFFDRLKRCDAFNDNSKIKGKKFISIACAGGSGNGTENTLNAFDVLNHFMNMEMIGRIPVTRFNYEEQKNEIQNSINKFMS